MRERERGEGKFGESSAITGGTISHNAKSKDTVGHRDGHEDGHGDRHEDEEESTGIAGLFKKLWMGDEQPGWQERRLRREREELESGKGYGDIIMGQVREVFPGFGGGGGGRREEGGEEEEEGGGGKKRGREGEGGRGRGRGRDEE